MLSLFTHFYVISNMYGLYLAVTQKVILFLKNIGILFQCHEGD